MDFALSYDAPPNCCYDIPKLSNQTHYSKILRPYLLQLSPFDTSLHYLFPAGEIQGRLWSICNCSGEFIYLFILTFSHISVFDPGELPFQQLDSLVLRENDRAQGLHFG